MPWNNQTGGGGPWKPGPKGPWGQGPLGGGTGGGGGGNGAPPDLEELLRRSQEKFRQAMPGGARERSAAKAARTRSCTGALS